MGARRVAARTRGVKGGSVGGWGVLVVGVSRGFGVSCRVVGVRGDFGERGWEFAKLRRMRR